MLTKRIIEERITVDTLHTAPPDKQWDVGSNWVNAWEWTHTLKRLWEQAIKFPYVRISPIHIEPDFDPSPADYPEIGLIIHVWLEVEFDFDKLTPEMVKYLEENTFERVFKE